MKLSKVTKILISAGLVSSLVSVAGVAQASAFQLWEQNGAGTGDYHAGGAAEANDASTAFYNPAGLTRLKGPQIVAGATIIQTHMPYKGTVSGNTFTNATVHAKGGVLVPVPFGYFAMPINNKWAAGFGIVAPFGLATKYGSNTELRYAATTTSLKVIDLTPNIAYQATKIISVGFGLDVQHLQGQFDQYATLLNTTANDTRSDNSGGDWALGWHGGLLFQFSKNTRVGFAYHSQVAHHLKGESKFKGPLANGTNGGIQTSKNLRASVTLPSYFVLSGFHAFNPKWSVLGTVMYTEWSAFNKLTLRGIAAIDSGLNGTNNQTVQIAEDYKNTWNFALGVHYKPVQKVMLKAGVGYDESPTRDRTRNVQLPGQDRIALAFGVHYQLLKKLGVDLGYTHLFVRKANINNTQQVGVETVTTKGHVKSNANLLGLQLTYDI